MNNKETIYPVAEQFLSPQGEATHAGVLMAFFRLAGCNVGKPFTKEERAAMPGLPIYTEKCHSFLGNVPFPCDTNYRMAVKMTLDAILDHNQIQQAEHICITGGEPLMHDLYPLVSAFFEMGKKVHIETSGSKSFKYLLDLAQEKNGYLWVTCSPKKGCTEESIALCHELKILVNEDFITEEFEEIFMEHLDKLWFSAINDEHALNVKNNQKCLELQRKYPQTRLSVQVHKILGVQ